MKVTDAKTAEIRSFLEQVALGNSEYEDISQQASRLVELWDAEQKEALTKKYADETVSPNVLLNRAQEAQNAYWKALHTLEDALNLEIDDPGDLEDHTIETLQAQYGDQTAA